MMDNEFRGDLRGVVLEVVRDLDSTSRSLQSSSVFDEVVKRLGLRGLEQERALLTVFGDLFRVGHLAWGYNIHNANPPLVPYHRSGAEGSSHIWSQSEQP